MTPGAVFIAPVHVPTCRTNITFFAYPLLLLGKAGNYLKKDPSSLTEFVGLHVLAWLAHFSAFSQILALTSTIQLPALLPKP